MLRREVIKRLAQKERISEDRAKEILTSMCGILEEGLQRDGKVIITRFGTFSVRIHKGRYTTDVRTHERIFKKERVCVKFRACKDVRTRLNNEFEEQKKREEMDRR